MPCRRHPTEIAKSAGRLKVDREWYLSQQLLPPIARLCEPIEGTSVAQLAECLGLDSHRFSHTYMSNEGMSALMARGAGAHVLTRGFWLHGRLASSHQSRR